MAFNDLLPLDGVGHTWLLDVSFDDFASVAYRWSTVSVLVSGNQYEARISKLGKLSRGFGTDGVPRAGTVSLLLENTDFGADWLVSGILGTDDSTENAMKAHYRLKLALYQRSDPAGTLVTKTMGTFKCQDYPRRDLEVVTLQLIDDIDGLFRDLLVAPTIREWRDDAGSTATECPIHASLGPIPAVDWDVPVQLAFGTQYLKCFPAASQYASISQGSVIAIPVCATRATADVTTDDVRALRGVYADDVVMGNGDTPWPLWAGVNIGIPKTYTYDGESYTIWEPKRTQVLTKNGDTWQLIWVRFVPANYRAWFAIAHPFEVGGAQPDGSTTAQVNVVPYAPQGRAGWF